MTDAIDEIIHTEGGYVNNKADKGGPTKYGITQRTLSYYLNRQASIEDVKNVTKETAREIYEKMYLTGPRISTLPFPIQNMILDMAINHGPRNAIKMLQRTVNASGFGPISVDGVLGPNTRKHVEEAISKMGKVFQNAVVEERITFMKNIVIRDPSQSVFIDGWVARAKRYIL